MFRAGTNFCPINLNVSRGSSRPKLFMKMMEGEKKENNTAGKIYCLKKYEKKVERKKFQKIILPETELC